MVFLATPHRGSDLAASLNNLLRISTNHSTRPFITNLERRSELITILNDSFRHYVDDLFLYSFYETQPTNLKVRTAMIVEKDSAVLGYPREKSQPLNADHRGICKFETPLDPNYVALRDVLQLINEKLLNLSNAHCNRNENSDH